MNTHRIQPNGIIINVEDLSGWLLKTLEGKGWTQSELARQSGVNQVTISRILNGERGMGIDVAVKLADTLGIEREEILERMGVLRPSPPTDTPSIHEMNKAFAYLDPNEQEFWLRMLQTYVADRRGTYQASGAGDSLQPDPAPNPS